jgi:glycosyltransferase involved in cell wall biosynthesis
VVQDIRELHAAADVLVLCSDMEALGRCVVEAMAMAVPVVTTNTGGTHEIVKHGQTGFVVPGGDWRALGGQLLEVFSNPQQVRSLAAAARKLVETSLDTRVAAQNVMNIDESVLAQHQESACNNVQDGTNQWLRDLLWGGALCSGRDRLREPSRATWPTE